MSSTARWTPPPEDNLHLARLRSEGAAGRFRDVEAGTVVNALAVRQLGLVTWRQCSEATLTERAVLWRLTSGTWTRIHSGVYLTRPGPMDWSTEAGAAVLACGPGAALRDVSAYWAAGVRAHQATPPHPIYVAVPHGRHLVEKDGMVITQRRGLAKLIETDPVAWPSRIRLAETILDMSAQSAYRAVSLITDAQRLKLTTAEDVADALAKRERHPQRRALEVLLGTGLQKAESWLETRFVRRVERPHGLPRSVQQFETHWGGVERHHDFGNEEFKIISEVDGAAFHAGARQQEDRARDRAGSTEGWITARFGYRDVEDRSCASARELEGLYRSRGWDGRVTRCPRCP